MKAKQAILGQTEEKIYEYIESLGIPRRNKEEINKDIGVPYTNYQSIPRPDIPPLNKEFKPTFFETLTDSTTHKDTNPLKSLN